MIESTVNWILEKVGTGLTNFLSLLPTSPFEYAYSIDNKFLQLINYILPFSQAVAHLTAYVSAVVIYYGIRIVLKWLKAAGN